MGTRLYLDSPLAAGERVEAGSDAAQYLGRALRMKRGDTLSVFNGRDGEYAAEIVEQSRGSVVFRLAERLVDPTAAASESPLCLHLAQSVSRGERMDLVVQKTTELGVSRITPVLTRRGVVKFDQARGASRQLHWQRIAINAAEQCGRLVPPTVERPLPLDAWLERVAADAVAPSRWLLDTRSGKAIDEAEPIADGGLCLLVGPEGGFADREYADAAAAGFDSVSLGPRVLRTETAGIVAVALAQARFGDL